MAPEMPVVHYWPQVSEPGWSGLAPAFYPAAIRSLDVGGAAELEVAGPSGSYIVTHVHEAAEPTPGRFTRAASVLALEDAPPAPISDEAATE